VSVIPARFRSSRCRPGPWVRPRSPTAVVYPPAVSGLNSSGLTARTDVDPAQTSSQPKKMMIREQIGGSERRYDAIAAAARWAGNTAPCRMAPLGLVAVAHARLGD
jgi:hypothetical protein